MQPRYPLTEVKEYVRESDGHVCFAPIHKKPKDVFVSQARKVWGCIYDYTDSVYTGGKAPITIYCPRHDHHFTVAMAQNHLMRHNATGCPVCAAEKRHGREYGTDWRKFLKLCAKNNQVGKIVQTHSRPVKTPEQIAAEKAEREAKAEARRREQQAYIEKWGAKNLKEAHFLEKLQIQYPDMYLTNLVDFKDKDHKVTLVCPTHGEFRITPRQLFGDRKHKAHGCWKCAGLKDPDDRPVPMTANGFFQRMHQLYYASELDFTTSAYLGLKNSVTAYCRKHGKISHSASYWLSGKGCEYCNGKTYYPRWKDYAREKHGDKYEYVGDVPQRSTDLIHYICKEHGLIKQRYDIHVSQGCGCPKCANYPNKKSPEQRCQEWIQKCIDKYGPDRYDYSRAHEDYVNNDSLVWIRCCIHDRWFQQTPDNNLRTINGSCPVCSAEFQETQGEAAIRRWLLKHDITNFKQDEVTIQHNNPRCRRQYLRPDFWLPDYNLFIEYNGEQHYKEVAHFNDEHWTFQDQQIRDETLRRYCADPQHFHHLLEIPYWELDRIGSILTSVLIDRKAIPTFEPPQPSEEASL